MRRIVFSIVFSSGRKHFWFSNLRNRDGISTRKLNVGVCDTFHAHVVSYADDFVILSRGRAAEALAWTKAVMTKLGLCAASSSR
jgi:hypothetical protein